MEINEPRVITHEDAFSWKSLRSLTEFTLQCLQVIWKNVIT